MKHRANDAALIGGDFFAKVNIVFNNTQQSVCKTYD
jgi:hypothetical protein